MNAEWLFLVDLHNNVLDKPGVKQVFLRQTTISGHEAMEYIVSVPDQGVQIRALVVVRGKYYYTATLIGPPELVSDVESDRFINSFRFNDESGS